jgi:hypothetical protein
VATLPIRAEVLKFRFSVPHFPSRYICHFRLTSRKATPEHPIVGPLLPTKPSITLMKMVYNVLMQYSLVSAIMKGIGTNGILISSLKGNHGLDTCQQMDDEMVMIEGRV